MKRRNPLPRPKPLAALLMSVMLCGCHKSQPPPPVVHVPPVLTRPFDDGYQAGYERGSAAAKPRARLPNREDVETWAAQAAAGEHEDKWQRGWVEGYIDGYRAVATHQK